MKVSASVFLSLALLVPAASGCGGKIRAEQESSPDLCSDSIDNDGDGFVDCHDQDCEAYCSVPENDPMLCSDGVDNDADGLPDCDDPDCRVWCADASSDPVDDLADPPPEVTEPVDPRPESDEPDAVDAGEDPSADPVEDDAASDDPVEAPEESDDGPDEEDGEDADDAVDIEEDDNFDMADDAICNVGVTGDACSRPEHCACVPSAATECLTTMGGYFSFPGGYCSARCTSSSECGTGAACAEMTVGTRYCLKMCSSMSHCRMAEGYACQTIPMSGDTQTYCLPNMTSEPDF